MKTFGQSFAISWNNLVAIVRLAKAASRASAKKLMKEITTHHIREAKNEKSLLYIERGNSRENSLYLTLKLDK